MGRRRRHYGFTLIELLVSVGIISILLSLMVCAAQMAREASRKLKCENGIRQVALAVLNYEQAHRRYPSAISDEASPFLAIASYLELSVSKPVGLRTFPYSVGEPFDFWGSAPFLNCPSDSAGSGTNYRFNTGSGPYSSNRLGNLPGGGNGPFNDRSVVSSSAVTDGLSNTTLVSERCRGFNSNHVKSGIVGDPMILSSGHGGSLPDAAGFSDACKMSLSPDVYLFSGRDWLRGGYFFTLYNHAIVPNSTFRACTNVSSRSASPVTAAAIGPTSWHASGVNVAFCDGHVAIAHNAVDFNTWQLLGARDDGKAVPQY